MVPRATTLAVVEGELPALRAVALRRGWRIDWQPDLLVLIADGVHPADQSPARFHADLAGYAAVPPAWRSIRPDAETPEALRPPLGGALPGGVGSMFHGSGVICAPFNRLAYQEHGGPHNDWSGAANWQKVSGSVTAYNLAEMLAQIAVHLKYSPGWTA